MTDKYPCQDCAGGHYGYCKPCKECPRDEVIIIKKEVSNDRYRQG